MSDIAIFESTNGDIQVQLEKESVWLSEKQLARLLGTSSDNISLHLKSIYLEQELEQSATTEDFSVVQKEGERSVNRTRQHYNLDAIISVAYRVNSKQGVKFRQWATKLLKEQLSQGYRVNQQRIEQHAQALDAALQLIRKTAASPDFLLDTGRGFVEIVSRYTHTFLWLQRYDDGQLNEPEGSLGGILPTYQQASESLAHLKQSLIGRGEATELFAQSRGDGLDALLGNLDQTVFGAPAYPSIQSKAAHLLYFVVKNHPFTDGNKRSGAFLFVDFLHRNNHLMNAQGQEIINDTGLAALTLLVAQSDPKQKETLIRLIMNMLSPDTNPRATFG
ncbi:MAG: prophage maintenance system killer protein/transcriptional regulator [Oleiphilaceae bacterium]|jgi:prophage maintenance system killer protein/transcriptional regulator